MIVSSQDALHFEYQIATFKSSERYILKAGVTLEGIKKPSSESGSSPESVHFQTPVLDAEIEKKANIDECKLQTHLDLAFYDETNNLGGGTDSHHNSPDTDDRKFTSNNEEKADSPSESGSDSDSESDSNDSGSDSGSQSKSGSPAGTKVDRDYDFSLEIDKSSLRSDHADDQQLNKGCAYESSHSVDMGVMKNGKDSVAGEAQFDLLYMSSGDRNGKSHSSMQAVKGSVLTRELSHLELGEFREPMLGEVEGKKRKFDRKSSFKSLDDGRDALRSEEMQVRNLG